MKDRNILVVGAGFSGSTIARILAENGYYVSIIDRRDHIAGNAFDKINDFNIRVHRYGPHIFHTSNLEVVNFLSRFTSWTPYKHKVKAMLDNGDLVTLPVNCETANIVGHENIIETFYRPYTKKMWDLDIEELDKKIINRVPIRDDMNEFYFPDDSFQGLPSSGYTSLIENIISHPNISINLLQDYSKDMDDDFCHIFNSMSIDEYFDYDMGILPYRSIKFHHFTIPVPNIFPVATVNFTHSDKYTRVTEWKKLPNHGANLSSTTLTVEEPCSFYDNEFERYYPVKDLKGINRKLYMSYKRRIPGNHTFIGRCGLYAYLDMDQAVNSALHAATKFLNSKI